MQIRCSGFLLSAEKRAKEQVPALQKGKDVDMCVLFPVTTLFQLLSSRMHLTYMQLKLFLCVTKNFSRTVHPYQWFLRMKLTDYAKERVT